MFSPKHRFCHELNCGALFSGRTMMTPAMMNGQYGTLPSSPYSSAHQYPMPVTAANKGLYAYPSSYPAHLTDRAPSSGAIDGAPHISYVYTPITASSTHARSSPRHHHPFSTSPLYTQSSYTTMHATQGTRGTGHIPY